MKKYLPFLRFALIACLSAFLAWKGQPFIHGNEKAGDLIINVFSILAGFLIAIMTLSSDIQFDQDANWRKLQLQETLTERRYTKHSLLFYTYLLVLICVFLTVLLGKQPQMTECFWFFMLEYAYLWLASISVFYSAILPSKLIQIRKEQYSRMIKDKLPKQNSHNEHS